MKKCLQYGPKTFAYTDFMACLEDCHKKCKGKDYGELERKLLNAAKSAGYDKLYKSKGELEGEVRAAVSSYCDRHEESKCYRY